MKNMTELINEVFNPCNIRITKYTMGYYTWETINRKKRKTTKTILNLLQVIYNADIDMDVFQSESEDTKIKIILAKVNDNELLTFYKRKGKKYNNGLMLIHDTDTLTDLLKQCINQK